MDVPICNAPNPLEKKLEYLTSFVRTDTPQREAPNTQDKLQGPCAARCLGTRMATLGTSFVSAPEPRKTKRAPPYTCFIQVFFKGVVGMLKQNGCSNL